MEKDSIRVHCISATLACLCTVAATAEGIDVKRNRVSSYGVAAHVTRGELDRLEANLKAMEYAGIRYVRSDVDHWRVWRNGAYDYSFYDRILGELNRRGMTLLPILFAKGDAKARVWENPQDYRAYVRSFARHFAGRLPAVEIWNEENAQDFWESPNPTNYMACLKMAYEEIKAADPGMRVAFGGTAGVPLDFIGACYENGAAKCCDILCVHPYLHPRRPEGELDNRLKSLRDLMGRHGDARKPVWITEIGWPTHEKYLPGGDLLAAGLRVARPRQKRWNVICAAIVPDDVEPDQLIAELLLKILPAGSTARVCSPAETCRRLRFGDADAVVYPFDETFPADTLDAALEFLRKGGTLVAIGGLPCYIGMRMRGTEAVAVKELSNGAALARIPVGFRMPWSEGGKRYPVSADLSVTEAGRNAGLRFERAGRNVSRFLAPDRLGPGDEFIPLLEGRTQKGVSLVGAAVVRYHSEWKGSAVYATIPGLGRHGWIDVDEHTQALYTVRSAAIAFAEGVESFFLYNLRAIEADPYDSESHFGILHADFTPKPAYSAYMNLIVRRPAGSQHAQMRWHDADRRIFYPQWTRPDGKSAGMVWSVGKTRTVLLSFEDGEVAFHDAFGKVLLPNRLPDGAWRVEAGEAPVYFEGSVLLSLGND